MSDQIKGTFTISGPGLKPQTFRYDEKIPHEIVMEPIESSLAAGDRLYGFCGGAFGRDHYYEYCTVEAIGKDWVIVRGPYEDDGPEFYSGAPQDLVEFRG